VSYVLRWFELLPPILQEVTMPAATTDRSSSASISADGRLVAFTSDADNLVAGDGNFDTDIFDDRQTQSTVRSSVRSDGTETGFELGSLNAALSADGQVVAFESEGTLVAEDGGFPVDVFVHDEQP
jgi:Tol biopolymer transport system component